MATRMQQRRGTFSQWDTSDPILNIGEIGYESDTNKFKIGDGINHWTDLPYFIDEETLGTSLDGYIPDSLLGVANGVAQLNSSGKLVSDQIPNIDEISQDLVNTALIAGTGLDKTYDDNAGTITLDIDSTVATKTYVDTAVGAVDLSSKQDVVSGVSSTEIGYLDGVTSSIQTQLNGKAASTIVPSVSAGSTVNLVANWNGGTLSSSFGLTRFGSGGFDVTGDSNDYLLLNAIPNGATFTAYDGQNNPGLFVKNANAVSGVQWDVTWVSGAEYYTGMSVYGLSYTSAGTEGKYLTNDGTTSSWGTLSKTTVGLANVDNTSDADKPVSTATQTALDLKANLAGPTFTGTTTTDDLVVDGDFTVNGTNFAASATSITIEDNLVQIAHNNPANTVDLGLVVGYNDGTAKHAGLVKDTSANTWKLFKGVTTEPATTVDFTEGSLDDLAVAGLTASSLTVGDVSNTEFGYLNGVTSAIQTQLDNKLSLESETTQTITGTVVFGSTVADLKLPDKVKDSLGNYSSAGKVLGRGQFGAAWVTPRQAGIWPYPESAGQFLTTDADGVASWATISGFSAPTIGSTSIASGATVTTISGLTDVVLNGPGSIKDELTLILMGAL